ADGVGGAALWLDQRAQTFRAVCRRRAQRSRRASSGGGKAVPRRALTDVRYDLRMSAAGVTHHPIVRISYFARASGECGLPVTHDKIPLHFELHAACPRACDATTS